MSKGTVFVLSGPSGSGKDTVLKRVLERIDTLDFSISCVTRPKRGSEKEDGKYRFLSVEEFQQRLARNEFLEHNVFLGNYYGTPRRPVEDAVQAGRDILIEIDVNGAAQIRKSMPDAVSIFIMPPSFEVLRQRLSGRGTDPEEVVSKRLEQALLEIACAKDYDFVIVNDDLNQTVEDVCSVIRSVKFRSENMNTMIDEVLHNA